MAAFDFTAKPGIVHFMRTGLRRIATEDMPAACRRQSAGHQG
jgi:hypothetical protein